MGGNEMYRESHLYHEGYTDGHRDGWKDAKRAAEEKARKPPAPVDEAAVEALARGIEPGVGAVVREKSKGGWAWTRESDGRWRSYGSDGTKRGDSTFDKITANTSVTLVPPPTPAAPPAPAPGEGAVEALARRWEQQARDYRTAEPVHFRALAEACEEHARELRGAVPGYGPTGASVGAGEVEPWALRQAIGIIEHAYNGDEMVPGCLTALRAALDTP